MNFYVIDKEGLATLCADKQDAETTAKEADLLWPKNAPHKVAKIVQEQPAPAAPVPLTDEQRADFLGCLYHTMSQRDLEFFRLGEAAYGITKGQP